MTVPESSVYLPIDNLDGEEEFCSCRDEDEEWQETDESLYKGLEDHLDDSSLRIFFKGVSVSQPDVSSSGLSGIGLVMERSSETPVIRVQKKLEFYVEAPTAEYLALLDGLLEAQRIGVQRVLAFTDSEAVHLQISEAKKPDDPVLAALGERILELAKKFEVFILKLIQSSELKKSLLLAQQAIGLQNFSAEEDELSLIPGRGCPFPNCTGLLRSYLALPTTESSSTVSSAAPVECLECHRLACASCHLPWHLSMSCEDYQKLPEEERNLDGIMLHQLARDNNLRQCERCARMIELMQGCYHTICWCGHEFCFSCGMEYRERRQTCNCTYHNDRDQELPVAHSNQESELWRWESFELPNSTLDAYTEQERSQLALIQRFLAGGFGLSDLNPCQSPPRYADAFVDTVKDLHQLPWLERFVSVISDSYQDDYIQ